MMSIETVVAENARDLDRQVNKFLQDLPHYQVVIRIEFMCSINADGEDALYAVIIMGTD